MKGNPIGDANKTQRLQRNCATQQNSVTTIVYRAPI